MGKIVLPTEDSYLLSLSFFKSDLENAAGVVQIVHGMEEHKERYYDFALFLAENGLHVVVSDLRSHGEDAPVLSHIADKRGDWLLIRDQQVITDWIASRFPDLPLMLFGHSMGSIISRVLLQTDSRRYARTALSGYVNPNPAAPVAIALGNAIRLSKSSRAHSKLLNELALGPYGKSIPDRKTSLDWLSYNEENVRKYIADPLCGAEFTVGSYCALFSLLNRMQQTHMYRNVNAEMPILLISGSMDPVGGYGKGVRQVYADLLKTGHENVKIRVYDGARHELFNETNAKDVLRDLLEWMDDTRKRAAK